MIRVTYLVFIVQVTNLLLFELEFSVDFRAWEFKVPKDNLFYILDN